MSSIKGSQAPAPGTQEDKVRLNGHQLVKTPPKEMDEASDCDGVAVYAKVCRTDNLTGISMFIVYQS
jgi:hypothetical protein